MESPSLGVSVWRRVIGSVWVCEGEGRRPVVVHLGGRGHDHGAGMAVAMISGVAGVMVVAISEKGMMRLVV